MEARSHFAYQRGWAGQNNRPSPAFTGRSSLEIRQGGLLMNCWIPGVYERTSYDQFQNNDNWLTQAAVRNWMSSSAYGDLNYPWERKVRFIGPRVKVPYGVYSFHDICIKALLKFTSQCDCQLCSFLTRIKQPLWLSHWCWSAHRQWRLFWALLQVCRPETLELGQTNFQWWCWR